MINLQQQSSSTSNQSTSSWSQDTSSVREGGDRRSGFSSGGRQGGVSSRGGVGWDNGGWDWAPGGVFSDNIVDGDGSSGNQSRRFVFVTLVRFTRSDGD